MLIPQTRCHVKYRQHIIMTINTIYLDIKHNNEYSKQYVNSKINSRKSH